MPNSLALPGPSIGLDPAACASLAPPA